MQTNIITRAAESIARYEAELGNIASYAINYDANPVGSLDGNTDFNAASNPLTSGNRFSPFYVYYTDNSLVVKEGTVNSVIATGLEPSGSPDTLWLKATLDTSQNVTTVAVETSEPSADSATQAKLRIASISWSNGVPTITNYLSGSQQLASCGETHYWGVV